MEKQLVTWHILYHDDGPNGPCGQSCHTTSPWSRLYRFIGTHAECKDRAEKLRAMDRKNPRTELFAVSDVVANWFGCGVVKSIF